MTAIEHNLVSARFRRSMDTYDEAAQVQKDVGDSLVSELAGYPEITFGRVLEIGCCTGSMTQAFCGRYTIGELWLNDLVPECCERAEQRVAGLVGRVHTIPGDVESLSLPAGFDLVVSSSTFQWLRNLPGFLARISEALRDGGHLVFSMFGPGTMRQVKELTEVGLRYSGENEIAHMLKQDFQILSIMTKRYRLYFDTSREVLRHIQQTGVGGAGSFRWTPSRLREFEKEYRARFGEERGLPLDYVSISAVAKKKTEDVGHAG